MKNTLEDRMKLLEGINKNYFTPKQPAIVKIKCKNFSKIKQTFTKEAFCPILDLIFKETILGICPQFETVEFVYYHWYEITFLLKDYNNINQKHLFNGDIQKTISSITSAFTYYFNNFLNKRLEENGIDEICNPVYFECDAATSLPLHEVNNYFMWRQNVAIKNSVNEYASCFFDDSQLFKKNTIEKIKMLNEKGNDWNKIALSYRSGLGFKKISKVEKIQRLKWAVDTKTPLFSEDINYIKEIVEIK